MNGIKHSHGLSFPSINMAPASEQSKDKAESPVEETAEETESEYEIEKILDVEKLKDVRGHALSSSQPDLISRS